VAKYFDEIIHVFNIILRRISAVVSVLLAIVCELSVFIGKMLIMEWVVYELSLKLDSHLLTNKMGFHD
jgi:hypothetical protein